MKYLLFKCPVCGSNLLKEIDCQMHDKDVIAVYKCLSCDSIVSNSIQREKDLANKIEEEKKKNAELISNKELLGQEIYKKVINSIVEIRVEHGGTISAGTGVVLKEGIVTNAHVILKNGLGVNSIKQLSIQGYVQSASNELELSVIKLDEDNDLAILRSDNVNLNAIDICNDDAKNGEKVYIIGNPLGQGISIVEGVVSDGNRILNNEEWVMFSGQINSGNSGGALLNAKGALLGIVTLTRTDAVGMNYAVPIKRLLDCLYN